ncbi:hypothetical protein J6590_033696 [Homalodisca vitripennis]|nr:hypothetical protein J6590_033696 [Homalodisca vitripennis]
MRVPAQCSLPITCDVSITCLPSPKTPDHQYREIDSSRLDDDLNVTRLPSPTTPGHQIPGHVRQFDQIAIRCATPPSPGVRYRYLKTSYRADKSPHPHVKSAKHGTWILTSKTMPELLKLGS